jgi:hypothetical protein
MMAHAICLEQEMNVVHVYCTSASFLFLPRSAVYFHFAGRADRAKTPTT